jgi:hypothetical protein
MFKFFLILSLMVNVYLEIKNIEAKSSLCPIIPYYDKNSKLNKTICDFQCCLPNDLYLLNNVTLENNVQNAFIKTRNLLNNNTLFNLHDLFHGHLIIPTIESNLEMKTCSILFLIHAFEYPKDLGVSLGYCQSQSQVSIYNKDYNKRNLLFCLDDSTLPYLILPCKNDFCTVYAEDYGLEALELYYVSTKSQDNLKGYDPPILAKVYAEPVYC